MIGKVTLKLKKLFKKDKGKEFVTVINNKDVHAIVRKYNDPEKFDEYRNLWKQTYDLKNVPSYPIQLDFELNYSCNFRCPMCTWSAESTEGTGKETWFDFDVYKEVIDDGVAKGLKVVRLNYINEPLIRADLFKFITYARQAGILDVYFSTNGSLLTPKISKKLIESGLTRLQVSLDAASEETYKHIRISNYTLEKIVKNIETFKDIRDNEYKSELPTLRVNFVKTETNRHEFNQFVDFWRERSDAIGVQDLVNIMKPTINNSKSGHSDFKCTQPFKHLVIRYNGHILPCCTFFGAELPIARLKTNKNVEFSRKKNLALESSPLKEAKDEASLLIRTIEDAWNSAEINFLRQIHKKGEYWKHPVCKKCVESSSHHDETQG